MRRSKISKEQFAVWYKDHVAGLSLKDIVAKHNVKYITLITGFKRLGFEIYTECRTGKARIGTINHDYFSKIDTIEKAYFLGLLASDGYVTHRKHNTSNQSPRVCLKLHKDDKYLVEALRDAISPGRNLYIEGNSYALQVPSIQIAKDLYQYGIIPNKTGFEKVPSVTRRLMKAYFLGLFDGDGSISVSSRNKSNIYICTSSLHFAKELQYVLAYNNIESTVYKEDRSNNNFKPMYRVGILSRVKFYNFLYSTLPSVYMIRKKELFDQVNTVLTAKKAVV